MLNKVICYVTMTDKFMSGWGQAQGKINKLIFECESYEEAEIVSDNAKNQGSMKHINICSKKPSYPNNGYLVQTKTKEDYSSWYIKDNFKKEV